MKLKFLYALIVAISIYALSAGCSSRSWYDGMQSAAGRDCDKYQYQSVEYEKCMENANISYDQYSSEIDRDREKREPKKK